MCSLVLMLLVGIASYGGCQAQQCFYQYTKQPAPTTSELDCNIMGAHTVKMECWVSGPVYPQFSLQWHFSEVPSTMTGRVLVNDSTFSIQEGEVNTTSLLKISKLTINGFDDKAIGYYWCGVMRSDQSIQTPNPSQILTVTAPCSVEQLASCTHEVQLFQPTQGIRCANGAVSRSLVQGGNTESQCVTIPETTPSQIPPTTTQKKQDIQSTTDSTTTIPTESTTASTKEETKNEPTITTDPRRDESTTPGEDKDKDRSTPALASSSTGPQQSSSSVIVESTTDPTNVVDSSSSFPMSIIWIVIGVVFVLLLGGILILLALVVCLQCRKNRIKGFGAPTHNALAYTSSVRVEEIDTIERNPGTLIGPPGHGINSTQLPEEVQYEQIPPTNFIQVNSNGSGISNPTFEGSDESPKTPKDHSMQHALPVVPNYEDVENLMLPNHNVSQSAAATHKYETVFTEGAPEYSHLQHTTAGAAHAQTPHIKLQRLSSSSSGVHTACSSKMCGRLSESSGTVNVLTESLFDNSDYALSSACSNHTDQHGVNIYKSDHESSEDEEEGGMDILSAESSDADYSRLNRERAAALKKDSAIVKANPVGTGLNRVNSLPPGQRQNYDSLERNHPPPGYEKIELQSRHSFSSMDPKHRKNYSSLERNEPQPPRRKAVLRYEPVEFSEPPMSVGGQRVSKLLPKEHDYATLNQNQTQQTPPGYEPIDLKSRHSYSSIDPKHRKLHATYSFPIVSTPSKYVSEKGHFYHVLEKSDKHPKSSQMQQSLEGGKSENGASASTTSDGPTYHVLEDAIASMEEAIASMEETDKKKKEVIPVYSVVNKTKKDVGTQSDEAGPEYHIQEQSNGAGPQDGDLDDEHIYLEAEGHD